MTLKGAFLHEVAHKILIRKNYDSTTNQNFCIGGNEKETAIEFKKLVDLYHKL